MSEMKNVKKIKTKYNFFHFLKTINISCAIAKLINENVIYKSN